MAGLFPVAMVASASRSANRSIVTQPVEAIIARTEAMVRQDPTCRPAAEWSADMRTGSKIRTRTV